jgi:hypothetical protein
MKKVIILVIVIIGITNVSKAQLEVTTNPIGLLMEAYTLSVDYNINEKFSFGLEGAFVNIESEMNFFYGTAKFHPFSTEKGSNRFYIGVFSGQSSYKDYNYYKPTLSRTVTQVGVGFMAGYKAVSRRNIVFDLGIGLGKGWGSDDWIQLLPYLKINLGYRFNVKTKDIATFKS